MPRCEKCGLDYGFADAGDGPAVFVILIGGAIVVFAALMTEVVYQPPYWVHAALWLPLILIVTLVPLRLIKGLLIALQYHHKAAEGRLESGATFERDARQRHDRGRRCSPLSAWPSWSGSASGSSTARPGKKI